MSIFRISASLAAAVASDWQRCIEDSDDGFAVKR